jgi:hypothetical protein
MGSTFNFTASFIKPADGVTPPTPRAEHNSTRSAPADAAFFIPCKEVLQTSTFIKFILLLQNKAKKRITFNR